MNDKHKRRMPTEKQFSLVRYHAMCHIETLEDDKYSDTRKARKAMQAFEDWLESRFMIEYNSRLTSRKSLANPSR